MRDTGRLEGDSTPEIGSEGLYLTLYVAESHFMGQ
jgi:hypothetical protein